MTQQSFIKSPFACLKGFAFASIFSLLAACGANDSNNDNEDSIPDGANKNPVTDTTPPVITLNGGTSIQLEVGSEYIEAGATASDNIDGVLEVNISGHVDSNDPGTYILVYTAEDKTGNNTTLTRTVTVVDSVPPTISLVGDPYVLLNAGELYAELGATAEDNSDRNVSIAIGGEVDTTALGEYILTYTATDTSGNSASIQRFVNVIDTIPPVIHLFGEASIELVKGETYEEPGFAFSDNLGQPIEVVTEGNVNPVVAGSYTLSYTATDSNGNSSSVTRTVIVREFRPFITTWKTDNDGNSNFKQIEIKTNSDSNFTVDWGDGTVQSGLTQNATHSYHIPGTYTVKIYGSFNRFYFESTWSSDAKKLLSVEEWGDVKWSSMNSMFKGAEHLELSASDSPDLSDVTDMSNMFAYAKFFNADLSQWDVSNVTNMSAMFNGANSFNGDISTWDTSNVTDMDGMFQYAYDFNNDLSNWDVSSVKDMARMFRSAKAFNSDISEWVVSNVTNMTSMFFDADSFNQSLNEWDVSQVTTMISMFKDNYSFNQDLDKWDVSNVIYMFEMFEDAYSFNGNISSWNVSNVKIMRYMFENAREFDGDLSGWNVSSVKDMSNMFSSASKFNSDLKDWNVTNVESMSDMFEAASSFNGDIGNWNVSNVTDMSNMFRQAKSFNQDISGWDVNGVYYMEYMFQRADAFDQDLSSWNVSYTTTMTNMFSYSGLSTENYDSILNGWSSLSELQRGITLGAHEVMHSSASESARSVLLNSYGWTIIDGGSVP